MNSNQARPVKTTLTSVRIVREIKRRNGASLTEVAEEIGLAKSTVHNHLATLTNEGFLVQQGQQYHVGLEFLQFGEYARNRRLYRPAKVQIYRLAEATSEEANFAVAENGFIFSIENVMGDPNPTNPDAGSQFLKPGSKSYMHNSATGKAILSELPVEEVERILELRGLPATTENTLTERDELLEELETVRKQGYATNDEELRLGFRMVSAPVHRSDGTVLGALSIGGPAYRFEVEPPAVTESVNTISSAIDHAEEKIAQLEPL